MAAPLLLSPEVVSSGISALGSFGSTILNGVFNRQSMDDQINKAKGLMKYEWDLYKSPKAQLGSLAEAGFNPAVALGEGRNFSASINPVLPSSVTPQIGGVMDIANFVKAMAEAKKAGLESTAQEMENEVNRQTQDERIRAIGLQNKFTEEQTTKVIQEWNKTIGEINVLQKDSEIKQIDLDKHEALVNSVLRNYADKHKLDNQQFEALKEQLPVVLDKLKAEEKILSIDADINENFKATMTNLGVVGQAVQVLAKIVSIFK